MNYTLFIQNYQFLIERIVPCFWTRSIHRSLRFVLHSTSKCFYRKLYKLDIQTMQSIVNVLVRLTLPMVYLNKMSISYFCCPSDQASVKSNVERQQINNP